MSNGLTVEKRRQKIREQLKKEMPKMKRKGFLPKYTIFNKYSATEIIRWLANNGVELYTPIKRAMVKLGC